MMGRLWSLCAVLAMLLGAGEAAAQSAFIQIEAQPSLSRAEDRVRDYATYLSDVNGFALGGGWYGIALGPYDRPDAAARLRELRAAGQIPGDSYLEPPSRYRSRFYPVGAGAAEADDATGTGGQVSQDAAPAEPDETPNEARASEAELSRPERERLQRALEWAGFYDGPIDAAFGQGTRNAMAGWQRANGYRATGILTTRQRAALIGSYNSVLDGLGMEPVTDERAGIRIEMPTAAVAFGGAASPFVRYEPTGDLDARVLLISEPGDRQTMTGLFEILQTLEIVPRGSDATLGRDEFVISGRNSRIVSHTEARLSDGAIKGFTLVWPRGDEDRRSRVLAAMQTSFAPVTGVVLDPATLEADEQSVDLVSGLEVRRPRGTASGFYIDRSGAVATALAAVSGCGRVTLDDAHEAEVVATDEALGAAILRPATRLAPREIAALRTDAPRLRSEIAVAGYSFGGVLPAPTVTWGRLEDLRGLAGEDGLKRLSLGAEPGDAGGPVLDDTGAVLGMLLPRDARGRQLPEAVSFAAKSKALEPLLREAGLSAAAAQETSPLSPEALARRASAMTVLVSCWD